MGSFFYLVEDLIEEFEDDIVQLVLDLGVTTYVLWNHSVLSIIYLCLLTV